jgi:hypothetical protein
LSELKKIDPDFTPSAPSKTLTEQVGKFFTEHVTVGPNGEQIKSRRLIEMG